MTEQRVVEASKEINATASAVFRALTHPLELSYWFCHFAWTEPWTGGGYHVRWRNGWWAQGVYRTVERARRIELTWHGKDEPGDTVPVFQLEPLAHGTSVRVVHSGYGAGAVWDRAVAQAEGSWPQALDNLESVLTTGKDKREADRPVLGIISEALTAELAAKNIGVDSGIYVASVSEDGGAAEAGLKKGDVITMIEGMAVSDSNALAMTLVGYRAGDRVRVGYVRGEKRGTTVVLLKPQPIRGIPVEPERVVEEVRKQRAALMADLRQTVAELSEEEVEKTLSPDEWSVRETLAHLSLGERFTQSWLADVIVGTTMGQSGGDPAALPEMLAMTLAVAPTVKALLNRWEKDTEATLALFAALRPEVVAMKARYRAMASSLLLDFQTRNHVSAIKAMVAELKR